MADYPDGPWRPDPLTVLTEQVKVLQSVISELKRQRETDETDRDKISVTQEEFKPVRLIVYGMVGVILIAVMTAIVTLVVKR